MSIDSKISDILEKACSEGRKWLLEYEAKTICKLFNIPVPEWRFAKNLSELLEHAKAIGYPVVLKIVSREILHKSDVGGVILNIRDEDMLKEAYEEINNNISKLGKIQIDGYLIERMAKPSIEAIIGAKRDRQFGPIVMFGVGGIFVELYRDISFRLAPVSRKDAVNMVKEVKGFRVLTGYRGVEAIDVESLVDAIVKVSNMIYSYQPIKEIDLNPVYLYKDGILAVDARIILT